MNEPRLHADLFAGPTTAGNGADHGSGLTVDSIGAILIAAGRLHASEAMKIVEQQQKRGLRFGEAAVQLGILSADDINYALSRQFSFPHLASSDDSIATEVVSAFEPEHPLVEEMRKLRDRLIFHWTSAGSHRQAVAIVSPERGDGRSYIGANLAVVFAQLGWRTLLIDADVRRPRQHDLFRFQNGIGLSTVLAGRANSEAIRSVPSIATLGILPAGPTPPNPNDLFARSHFSSLLRRAHDDFDVLVLDAPPWSDGSGGRMVALEAGTAVIVARVNRSSALGTRQVALDLAQAGRPALGVVLNRR